MMVKNFFMLVTFFSISSLYSMEPEHFTFEIPRIEGEGQGPHDEDLTKENEELRLLRTTNNAHVRTVQSPASPDHSPSPTDRFLTISPQTPDSERVASDDETTQNVSQDALKKLESFSHTVSFSPRVPRLSTPEAIQAHDEEIKALITAYKAAREALPADVIRDIRLQDEYQTMVESKLKAIEHLKQSSGIGEFPDQSKAIIARQEKVIAYLKEKIQSLTIHEKLELRQALEQATDALIADIKNNMATSKIKDETTLYRINVLLGHMEEERNKMSDKTLLTDPKFDIMMTVRQMKVQELREDIEKLMSPNPKRRTPSSTPRRLP
jgi:hypothetical protein